MAQGETNVVVDKGRSSFSDLWSKEDYLAIWLGFVVIAVCLVAYLVFGPRDEFTQKILEAEQIQAAEAERAPFKIIAWYNADNAKKLKASKSSDFGKFISHWTNKPGSWKSNPVDAFIRSDEQAQAMNDKAMPAYEEAKAKGKTSNKPYNYIPTLIGSFTLGGGSARAGLSARQFGFVSSLY